MKKPIDKTYLENCFKDFCTYLLQKMLHKHDNQTTLDKIEESDQGKLLFNGSEINNGAGQDVTDGKSAYEIAVDNGYVGTETEWLGSLKGNNGNNGTDGQDGITPHIDPTTKHWFIGETDTGIVAEGTKGDKGDKGDRGESAENITLETLDAASSNHTHGYLKTVTLSTTEPETVAEGEIVLVYETE